jgi:Spy/CpxP family protein refolding chaperone
MKKLITIIGILGLIGVVAVPVMAWHSGWGRGHHMMGYWDNSPRYGGYYGNLTSDQISKLDALDRKFYNDTSELRDHIWTKYGEIDSILDSSNPDIEKAKALQKEISELRAKMDEKRLSHELETRKIIPQDRTGRAYGGWYGPHRGAYGHRMGYGTGYYCWN